MFVLLVLMVSTSCISSETSLQKKDIADLHIDYTQNDGMHKYDISGSCMHSALSLKNISYSQKSDTLFIEIVAAFAQKEGKSGSFKEVITTIEKLL